MTAPARFANWIRMIEGLRPGERIIVTAPAPGVIRLQLERGLPTDPAPCDNPSR